MTTLSERITEQVDKVASLLKEAEREREVLDDMVGTMINNAVLVKKGGKVHTVSAPDNDTIIISPQAE